ncbi:hypothetical protein [Rhodopila globiformis]|nr:hypothetical protein [Rhodopila globiformis]
MHQRTAPLAGPIGDVVLADNPPMGPPVRQGRHDRRGRVEGGGGAWLAG